MEYFNKFRATVTQVAAQVTNALPGNPLLREYEIGDQTCAAGPGFYWKVFRGCSVWIFDKKDIDRWPKDDRESFLSLIRQGVSQLTKLRHPRLLVVEHPIEESRDSLAFATEPVFACLANCLCRPEHVSASSSSAVSTHLNNVKFSEVEIKHGLFQLGEALSFLHVDAGILHRNVTPESVIVNDRGAWKLAGFEFSIQGRTVLPGKFAYETFNWDIHLPAISQPNLDYLAPEYVVGGGCDSHSDIYSLGVLSYAVFNECRPPFEHKNDLDRFKKNMEKLNNFHVRIELIPPVLLNDLKMCLKYVPNIRPDATQFTKIAYFNDPLVKTLNLFESLVQMENSRKVQFFKSLPGVLVRFEKRVLLQKVLPHFSCEFSTPDLIPFILPSIFLIIEQVTKEQFSSDILPKIIPLFFMDKPYQIALLLLQRMELLLEKASEEHVKCYILPLVYNALSSETMRIQELCISIVPNISKLVDRNSMKNRALTQALTIGNRWQCASYSSSSSFVYW
ncbi:SCY1-like protein 2 [Parelaphostrongylus tenuis]|uniref:SCY1-like protein 2 n=1 Tax=Parelaphostrongylus tenuis TaxID=148309 RepID=A0AAD5WH42_PARTN|nr:SCY1-like protein 2 [Parelaphostrongylus tenuis]